MYINDRQGGARQVRPGPGPSRTSVLSLMGFGGEDWTTFGQPTTAPATTTATAPATPSPSIWDRITGLLGSALTPPPGQMTVSPPIVPVVAQPGMSTTTKIALAGGALVALALIARK